MTSRDRVQKLDMVPTHSVICIDISNLTKQLSVKIWVKNCIGIFDILSKNNVRFDFCLKTGYPKFTMIMNDMTL